MNGDNTGLTNGRLPLRTFKRDTSPSINEKTDGETVYDTVLPPWRAAIRRGIVRCVERESRWLARMQSWIRTPWLDAYFVYTSALGTHTFFTMFLPGLFFFGYDQVGRGLLFVLALGVYCSSFVKDLVCAPRPYSPPVTRLTIGTHHLEYGFPSTHSTNSVSIALFFFTRLHMHYSTEQDSSWAYAVWVGVLLWYAVSVVFGRLYTAMHSFTDCAMGVVMGTVIWWVHDGYWGLGAGNWLDRIVEGHGVVVPLVLVPICMTMVNQHPQPVDDCPCFEDAIAFVSVVMGSLLARWHAVHYGIDRILAGNVMPGDRWEDVAMWWMYATLKMVVGIVVIFTWRIVAKSTLHVILPPTFRLLSQAFTLPRRRFYTPATDYGSVPSDVGLRPIPSMMDLPGELGFGQGEASGVRRAAYGGVRARGGTSWTVASENGKKIVDKERVDHYDADVLTKVIVYCGIAVLACEVLPMMFALGLAVGK